MLLTDPAIAKHRLMVKKTESPPDLGAFDLWEERLLIGAIILLFEKTE